VSGARPRLTKHITLYNTDLFDDIHLKLKRRSKKDSREQEQGRLTFRRPDKKIPTPHDKRCGDAVFHPQRCLYPSPQGNKQKSNIISAGLLASGSSYSPRLPILTNSDVLRLSSPVTAAGTRRIYTVLPFKALAGNQ